jgi:tetratricopeptide (TPR) repeat protein
LLQTESYAEAVPALDACLRHLPEGKEPAEVYRLRGLARAGAGDYPGAIEDYTRALGRRPEARTYALLGWAHLFQDSLTLAERYFDRALALDAALAEAYAGRGYAHAKRRRYAQAVADAGKAVEGGAAEARTLCNAARVLAEVLRQMGDDPRQRPAADLRRGHERRALELLRRATLLQPPAGRPAFWQKVTADPALRPLRGGDGFARLTAEFAGKPR